MKFRKKNFPAATGTSPTLAQQSSLPCTANTITQNLFPDDCYACARSNTSQFIQCCFARFFLWKKRVFLLFLFWFSSFVAASDEKNIRRRMCWGEFEKGKVVVARKWKFISGFALWKLSNCWMGELVVNGLMINLGYVMKMQLFFHYSRQMAANIQRPSQHCRNNCQCRLLTQEKTLHRTLWWLGNNSWPHKSPWWSMDFTAADCWTQAGKSGRVVANRVIWWESSAEAGNSSGGVV